MTNFFTTILIFLCCFTSAFSQTQSIAESVEYDPINNRFISGNDATSMIQQDTMGNLSYFGQGLSSNLGMEIIGNYIFCVVATDQFQPVRDIMVYDLTTETFVSSITIDNALLLNGMASDGVSKIWVTDLQGQSIYEVDFSDIMAPTSSQIAGGGGFSSFPNGITYDASQNRLVFVDWFASTIWQLDLNDNSVSVAFANTGTMNMDGIDIDGNNNFYVSSATPDSRVTKYANDFSTSEILDIPGLSNPADLCVAKEINMLAIPSFQHNVILWRLEDEMTTSTSDIHNTSEVQISTYPNPSEGIFSIEIKNENWKVVQCEILDAVGHLIKSTRIENNGMNQFQIDLSQYQTGTYYMDLTIDQSRLVSKLKIFNSN